MSYKINHIIKLYCLLLLNYLFFFQNKNNLYSYVYYIYRKNEIIIVTNAKE